MKSEVYTGLLRQVMEYALVTKGHEVNALGELIPVEAHLIDALVLKNPLEKAGILLISIGSDSKVSLSNLQVRLLHHDVHRMKMPKLVLDHEDGVVGLAGRLLSVLLRRLPASAGAKMEVSGPSKVKEAPRVPPLLSTCRCRQPPS